MWHSTHERARRPRLVAMMGHGVVLAGRMLVARRADLVARDAAVRSECGSWQSRATDSLVVHLALQERPELVVLVQDLAVGMVRLRLQQFVGEVVVVVRRRAGIGIDDAAPRVAGRAGVDLHVRVGVLQPARP